jgi:hypothetical protein
MEEMVNRRRVRAWRAQEMALLAQAYTSTRNEKLFERLGSQATKIMSMVLHLPGAYEPEQLPEPETASPSDVELLALLDKNLPDL